MALRIYLVAGFNGGSGRSLTAALLAYGLHLQAQPTMLVRQTYVDSISTIDPIETTLPLPCCDLLLPAPYQLPADLNPGLVATIHSADARFTTALMERATAEIGDDGDVVVDLCCHERALNAAAIRDAAVILVPVRTSVCEIDWAVRSTSYIRDTQRYRNTPVPTLLGTIAPDGERDRQMALLSGMLRDCDPDRELVPDQPADIVVDVPFLDEASLTELLNERPIWLDPQLIERCRAFAAAVTDRADAFMTLLAEEADDL